MKKNYNMKKTLSIKQFISEFDKDLTVHVKKTIMNLWPRCVLTRDKERNILDLKHVEHTKHDCIKGKSRIKKEYVFGRFIIENGNLYFSDTFAKDDTVMKSPMVDTIFESLSSEDMYYGDDVVGKKIDDSSIYSVINNIMRVCPPMSKRHLDIISKYCDVDDFNNEVIPY